jgi:hypothetical protein
MGRLSVKNSVSDSKPAVLPQPLNSTNHLVFKPDINYEQLGMVSGSHWGPRWHSG